MLRNWLSFFFHNNLLTFFFCFLVCFYFPPFFTHFTKHGILHKWGSRRYLIPANSRPFPLCWALAWHPLVKESKDSMHLPTKAPVTLTGFSLRCSPAATPQAKSHHEFTHETRVPETFIKCWALSAGFLVLICFPKGLLFPVLQFCSEEKLPHGSRACRNPWIPKTSYSITIIFICKYI